MLVLGVVLPGMVPCVSLPWIPVPVRVSRLLPLGVVWLGVVWLGYVLLGGVVCVGSAGLVGGGVVGGMGDGTGLVGVDCGTGVCVGGVVGVVCVGVC